MPQSTGYGPSDTENGSGLMQRLAPLLSCRLEHFFSKTLASSGSRSHVEIFWRRIRASLLAL